MVLEKLDALMEKKMNFDLYLTPWTKINSRWIINLSAKTKPIKLLEENRGKCFCKLGMEKEFLKHKISNHERKKNRELWLHQKFKISNNQNTILKM